MKKFFKGLVTVRLQAILNDIENHITGKEISTDSFTEVAAKIVDKLNDYLWSGVELAGLLAIDGSSEVHDILYNLLNALELGENKDIIMKLQGNDFTEENTDSYHSALDFLREIKTELQDTPMEKEEYIRIEFFF